MNKDDVILIRDVYRNAKIPYTIICDNSMLFNDGIDGSVILWSDDKEVFTCVRSNPEGTQALKPIEITNTAYEHIQFIRACVADPEVVKNMLETLGHPKANQVYEHVRKQDYMRSAYTGSTGDKNLSIPSYAEQMAYAKANNLGTADEALEKMMEE